MALDDAIAKILAMILGKPLAMALLLKQML